MIVIPLVVAVILVAFSPLLVEPVESKYKYEITNHKGTWFVNDYTEKDKCVMFVQESIKKEIKLCGTYSIENYKEL